MTETMIEKMARSMRDGYADHIGDRDIIPMEKAKSREAWIVCARAALQAIREVDDATLRAGMREAWTDADALQKAHRAMIDAILSGDA